MPVIDWPAESTVWVVAGGDLIPIRGGGVGSKLTVSGGPEFVLARTVDGGQRAQMVRRPRSWSGSVETFPIADLGPLLALQAGQYGPGPFGFVTPDMQFGNVLTPDASSWRPGPPTGTALGGPAVSPSGDYFPQSLLRSASGAAEVSPLVRTCPYAPFTVTAWVSGPGAVLRVRFLTAVGSTSRTVSSAAVSGSSAQRLTVTAQPLIAESWAVVDLVAASSGAVLYGLQVTWTDSPVPWVPGLGVNGVVLSGGGHDLVSIDRADGPYVSVNFVADEVA